MTGDKQKTVYKYSPSNCLVLLLRLQCVFATCLGSTGTVTRFITSRPRLCPPPPFFFSRRAPGPPPHCVTSLSPVTRQHAGPLCHLSISQTSPWGASVTDFGAAAVCCLCLDSRPSPSTALPPQPLSSTPVPLPSPLCAVLYKYRLSEKCAYRNKWLPLSSVPYISLQAQRTATAATAANTPPSVCSSPEMCRAAMVAVKPNWIDRNQPELIIFEKLCRAPELCSKIYRLFILSAGQQNLFCPCVLSPPPPRN